MASWAGTPARDGRRVGRLVQRVGEALQSVGLRVYDFGGLLRWMPWRDLWRGE